MTSLMAMAAICCLVALPSSSSSSSQAYEAEFNSSKVSRASDGMSAYELLEQYGFPGGLLPSNVQSYSLDSNNGKFALYLSSQCDVTIPGEYPVRYEKEISGKLSSGSISDLSGVSVKVLLLWWELTRIYMDGEKVVFEVGLLSASYPASNFEESPDCGSKLALY